MELYPSIYPHESDQLLGNARPLIELCANKTNSELLKCKFNLLNELDFPVEAFRYIFILLNFFQIMAYIALILSLNWVLHLLYGSNEKDLKKIYI
jgi:hypothetical protein